MRFQGRITQWNDERGFGFVEPNGGGERVFLHIKAFASRHHRPAVDQLVKYTLAHDGRGRAQAVQAEWVDLAAMRNPTRRQVHPPRSAVGHWRGVLAGIFVVLLVGLAMLRRLPYWLVAVYGVASLATYALYAHDKTAAQAGRWRTPERTLQWSALVGGWPGALLAQQRLHHKNRKVSFQLEFWLMISINVAALAWLLTRTGERWLAGLPTM